MEKDWVLLIASTDKIQLEILHKKILDNDIQAIIMDQHDSSYGFIGESKIYVHQDDFLKAAHLLKSTSNE